jgi:hypothetical protein
MPAQPTNPLEGLVSSSKIYPLHEEATDGLVVCCADPRFLEANDQFLADIGILHPAIIAVPGSIKSFGLQAFIPNQWHTLKSQLELMAKRNAHVPRVVLITHEDCKSYAASAEWLGGFARVFDSQREHLIGVARFLKERYLPSARVELYRARIVPNGTTQGIAYEPITFDP